MKEGEDRYVVYRLDKDHAVTEAWRVARSAPAGGFFAQPGNRRENPETSGPSSEPSCDKAVLPWGGGGRTLPAPRHRQGETNAIRCCQEVRQGTGAEGRPRPYRRARAGQGPARVLPLPRPRCRRSKRRQHARPGADGDPGLSRPTGWHYHECDGQFIYILKGWVDLQFEDGRTIRVEQGDLLFIPGYLRHNETRTSDEMEILEVSAPGELGTKPCEAPAGFKD